MSRSDVTGPFKIDRRHMISAFILLYLYSVGLCLCHKSLWQQKLIAPVRPLVCLLSLQQNYETYAPNPWSSTMQLDADITFNDGTTAVWRYPRVEAMCGMERIIKDRYRRLLYKSLYQRKQLWPGFSRYVARINDTSERHPVTVQLVKHTTPVLLPAPGTHEAPQAGTTDTVLFTYAVQKQDLVSVRPIDAGNEHPGNRLASAVSTIVPSNAARQDW